ncbi:ARF GTPase-activating protein GIT2a isoform X1 [Pimephales promelas]|uniref:ARF GTPase-activating protein GIT2a isoform X1 n=1 Tax=Pimephales promelas TaxID=90988 RepID=UPI001955E565|nr:ARF GTPase-activating protein GIT2a isoform X1 [Pimephales promelas]XP_039514660.1 ARF GTPase-activating protein GIT2a isoform X1 [Pimephales promelas]KAG1958177.1 ARF GTPase-activating protein GIT2 [Pimephales promelas]
MVIPALPETRMSKRLRNSEVCADCSSSDPRWASVNRGVLICDECCGVHRSLGRHNSQVRHLSNTSWPPTQLQMVQTLYNNGANAIWEHTLLDPSCIMSGKRKANPQDKIHPNKTEFIKAKYQMLAYVHRLPCRDDDSTAAGDLSKQLHSSVRTGNLETCLRLLSLGAQANYFHPEKGNTPLHIAAKAGQVCQAELLCVYGADPGAPDSNGKTPINYARQAGHQDLADRLVEVQYELTDRLAFYLCGRKPDHKSGQHFIIPQMADRNVSLELSEFAKAAKRKLQSLSDHLFEELAMDVYDEVDRRETDAVWLATQNHSTLVTETTVVPFLPVNPEYSSTRNQGRQKLARFNAHEFATLVIDILSDAKRRQLGNSVSSPKDNVDVFFKSVGSRHGSESQEIDQPDYDSVASDEDTDTDLRIGKGDRAKSLDSDLSDGPISVQEFLEVKNALSASEAKIQELMKANSNLSEELRLMQKKLQSLQSENSSLRRQVSAQQPYQAPGGPDHPNLSSPSSSSSSSSSSSALKRHLSARASRPMSMYETGSGLKPFLPKGEPPYPEETFPTLQPFPTYASKFDKQSSVSDGDYDNTVNESDLDDSGFGRRCRLRSSGWMGESGSIPELDDHESEPDPSLPSTEDVIRKTEQITKNIQELLRAAQENKHESFIPCAERIHVAVNEMAALFPKRPRSETARSSLRLLTSSANRLQNECKKASPLDSSTAVDMQLVTQQVIQCAYDIAKAAKQLVTITTKENNN